MMEQVKIMICNLCVPLFVPSVPPVFPLNFKKGNRKKSSGGRYSVDYIYKMFPCSPKKKGVVRVDFLKATKNRKRNYEYMAILQKKGNRGTRRLENQCMTA